MGTTSHLLKPSPHTLNENERKKETMKTRVFQEMTIDHAHTGEDLKSGCYLTGF